MIFKKLNDRVMRCGFYVSRNATRLKMFLKDNFDICDITFILTDNKGNTELSSLCRQHHIPFFEFSYKELGLSGKKQNEFISNKLLELLNETESDYCFATGARILEGEVLTAYENHLINLHPALLPAYKGLHAIDRALEEHVLLLGNTAHFITKDLDSGPMIMQNLILRKDFQNYDSVLDMQVLMFKQIILWLKDSRIEVIDGAVSVKDAVYELGSFIPRLEI